MAVPRRALPITSAQEGVWIGQRLAPASPLYNAAECVRINGPLDIAGFERALGRVVAAAEALHVRFESGPEGVTQLPCPPGEWPLPVLDVSGRAEPGVAARAWIDADLATLVDLGRGPLFAHALFVLGPERFVWYHRAHHIVLDGYGFSLVASAVARTYTAQAAGVLDDVTRFGPLRAVVEDDLAYRDSARFHEDREFWTTRFGDRPAAVGLSDRTSVPSGSPLRHSERLPAGALDRWRAVAEETGANWAEVVFAISALYVRRRTRAEEVVLGVPVMGRLGSVSARVPAMVMNIVPLRVPMAGGTALPDVVRTVATEFRGLRRHQRYRGELLRRDLGLVGGDRRLYGPLVNVMPFDYRLDFAGSPAVSRNISAGAAFVEDLAILLHARSDGEPPVLDLDANPRCYRPAELAGHADGLVSLMAGEAYPASARSGVLPDQAGPA
jgi:nonribosomal peptide synthetase MxcG